MKWNKSVLFIFIFFLLLARPQTGAEGFSLVEQWHHDTEIFGHVRHSIVDTDNHIVGDFFKMPDQLISPQSVTAFAPRGQGPGDLMNSMALFPYRGDIAIVEMAGKIKVFRKKEGTYVWKKTVWLKRGRYAHIVRGGIFWANKWFLTGFNFLGMEKKTGRFALLTVYDEAGEHLKNLLKVEYSGPNRLTELDYYIVGVDDRVFFLAENELKVKVIAADALKVIKEAPLKVPEFYKKMPADFYIFKRYDDPSENFSRDIEHWKTSYSRITGVVVDGNNLVLQVRTCRDKLKRFALLFYNIDNFKLERTVFIDDFLLGAREGKFYCYANGNPGWDEGADQCIINIYGFKDRAAPPPPNP
jgi:hypothetical protein